MSENNPLEDEEYENSDNDDIESNIDDETKDKDDKLLENDDDDDDDELEDDELEDEEINQENELYTYESDDKNQKKNIFDNSKVKYSKYDYEVEDLDENDFYKFNDELKKNHILNYHNECLYKNFNEIKELSKITKDKNGIIIDEFHKTIDILTKYEKTKILGMRVKQLNNGAAPYINVSEKIIDNYLIAETELKDKKLPFIIQRPLPNNNFEYWKLQDLDIL